MQKSKEDDTKIISPVKKLCDSIHPTYNVDLFQVIISISKSQEPFLGHTSNVTGNVI